MSSALTESGDPFPERHPQLKSLSEVQSERDEDNEEPEPRPSIPCSMCGKPTTFDPTYGDLCYRCCRADNE